MVKPATQRGIALLTVLWVVGLLLVLVGGYSYLVRTEVQLTRNQAESLRARLHAEAGVAKGLQQLLSGDGQNRWRRDGSSYSLALADGGVEVAIRDASGLVNLNLASPLLLGAMLKHAGIPFGERERLLDLILDWRDSDELVRLNGGERLDYRAAGLDYGPKNGPFERIDELGWVPGISAQLVARLRPHLTLYSGQNGVNPLAASPTLLGLLSGDEGLVEEIMAAREAGDFSYTQLRSRINWPLAASSDVAHIRARGYSAGGAEAELEVVVRLIDGGRSYQLLSWELGPLVDSKEGE